MRLTDRMLRSFKPELKPYKRADGYGLSILVEPTGSRLWRFRYRINGKEKSLSLGSYPEVSLQEARRSREDYRVLVARGIDPSRERRRGKLAAINSDADTFAKLAEEFVRKREAEGAAWRTIKKHRTLLSLLLPDLGHMPIAQINSPVLLAVLKKAEARGVRTSAIEARALAGRIFRFAIAQGRAEIDVSQAIRDALTAPIVKGYPGITKPDKFAKLLVDIRSYSGDPTTTIALELLARLFTRPGELRVAEWAEIDLSRSTWRIPAEHTKLRRDHLVPLSSQAVRLFEQLYELRADDTLVLGSRRKRGAPVSDMTFNKALRSLGYSGDVHVAHGFRTSASTLLNEQGYNRDWIERQLAHAERDKVRSAYNAAEYIEGRSRMMQEWSDYLDRLIASANEAANDG